MRGVCTTYHTYRFLTASQIRSRVPYHINFAIHLTILAYHRVLTTAELFRIQLWKYPPQSENSYIRIYSCNQYYNPSLARLNKKIKKREERKEKGQRKKRSQSIRNVTGSICNQSNCRVRLSARAKLVQIP